MNELVKGDVGGGAGQGLGRALGWFSLGLGASQAIAPGAVARFIGVDDSGAIRVLMRAVGGRELMAAAAILRRSRPAGWLWARVAGDTMDLVLLGTALSDGRNDRRRTAAAAGAVVGVAVLDLLAAARLSRSPRKLAQDGAMRAKTAITVNRSTEEAYGYWHDLENLPQFMSHLESVEVNGDGRSHWVAAAPAGRKVEWDAEITEDRPNELIAWRSVAGASVDNSGSVRFRPAPGGRGTEIAVEVEYHPPGGAVGAAVAKLFGEQPDQQVRDDLRRLKQVLETGEVVRSEGTPDGIQTQRQVKQRPAQPVA